MFLGMKPNQILPKFFLTHPKFTHILPDLSKFYPNFTQIGLNLPNLSKKIC